MISRFYILMFVLMFFSVTPVFSLNKNIELPKISRSQFTTAIENREPTGSVTALNRDTDKIYYFSEFIGFKKQEVVHQWIYKGQVMAEVPIVIDGSRWRAYSSKNLLKSWDGEWTVNILDSKKNIIETKSFQYGSVTSTVIPAVSAKISDGSGNMSTLPPLTLASPNKNPANSSVSSGNSNYSAQSPPPVNRSYSRGSGEVVDKVSELLATREKIVSIYFRSGSMILDYKQVDRIDRIVERLRNIETDQYIVRIEGMASPEGAYDSNVELSMGRAESVWKYLVIGQAINPEVLFMTGLGPINASRSDYDNLRRADIILYRMVVDFNDSVDLQ